MTKREQVPVYIYSLQISDKNKLKAYIKKLKYQSSIGQLTENQAIDKINKFLESMNKATRLK